MASSSHSHVVDEPDLTQIHVKDNFESARGRPSSRDLQQLPASGIGRECSLSRESTPLRGLAKLDASKAGEELVAFDPAAPAGLEECEPTVGWTAQQFELCHECHVEVSSSPECSSSSEEEDVHKEAHGNSKLPNNYSFAFLD